MDHSEHIQQVSRSNTFILTALWGFVFGILVASFIFIPPLVCLLIIGVGFATYYAERHTIILIVLCFFALGAFGYNIKDFHELVPAGTNGVVVSEPERRDFDTRFVVKTDTGEKVLVSTDVFNDTKYGDEVSFIGKAEAPKPESYAKYLSKSDIYYVVNHAKVQVISSGGGDVIIRNLLKIKSGFVERMKGVLPEPESSLLAGLVVSGKQALSKDILDEFRRAGVVHIVVLSGYNITIIAEFLFLIFGFLGSRVAVGASIAGVLLFTLMSGGSATVVRGAIMVLLLLLGRILYRPGSAPRILLFTAVLMLIHNPKILVFDPSFQLSFLALLGIIYGAPILETWLSKIPSKYMLRSIITTTLATQAFVFPYLLYNMGNFSLVFLLANLLILPILPIVMLIGFMATLLTFATSVLAWPLAFVSHLLLKWILFVAHFLGNLSFASIQIEDFPLWLTIILYCGVGFILWKQKGLIHKLTNSN
ncbi:MAG: ComEC/Rec2 family competence protein [Patescibacteria group bacterium]